MFFVSIYDCSQNLLVGSACFSMITNWRCGGIGDEDFLLHLLDKEATAFGVLRFAFVYLL